MHENGVVYTEDRGTHLTGSQCRIFLLYVKFIFQKLLLVDLCLFLSFGNCDKYISSVGNKAIPRVRALTIGLIRLGSHVSLWGAPIHSIVLCMSTGVHLYPALYLSLQLYHLELCAYQS